MIPIAPSGSDSLSPPLYWAPGFGPPFRVPEFHSDTLSTSHAMLQPAQLQMEHNGDGALDVGVKPGNLLTIGAMCDIIVPARFGSQLRS